MSEKTKETLRRLKKNGFILCIATGRPPVTLPKFEDIQIDVFLTFNGCLCYTQTETIYSNAMPREDVKKVIQNAATLGRPVSVAGRDRLVANGWDQDLADYYALVDLELEASEDFDTVCMQEVYQVMLGSREDEHAAVVKGVDSVKISISWDRAIDVIPVSGGKGNGINKILEYFQLEQAQALAFGDGYNDLDMLKAVGTGVAMGNANEQLKILADDICAPVSEDGIYQYCISHGLI